MPRQAKPPRLYLRQAQRDKDRRVTHAATYIILDGGRQFGTGCGAHDIDGANNALAAYIGRKYTAAARSGPRHTSEIPVVDVLTLYAKDVVPKYAQPKPAIGRLQRLGAFFANKTLADINGPLCRAYAEKRTTDTVARSDLVVLQAAINHHLREGLHDRIIKVVMPSRRPPRDRWLTRSEASRMIWRAWRAREVKYGKVTERFPRRHLARFLLVGLYTGSRADVIASASFEPQPGRPYIDLNDGMFYRRPAGAKETNKRRPTVRIPPRLLAHMRRWQRLGARYPVEIGGKPIKRIRFALQWTAEELGITGVTPHTLRHTCATWLVRDGVDLWEIAGFLGMSVQTLEKNYAHHSPDHVKGVHAVFQRRRTVNDSSTIDVNRVRTFVDERLQNASKTNRR
jgi:integrase